MLPSSDLFTVAAPAAPIGVYMFTIAIPAHSGIKIIQTINQSSTNVYCKRQSVAYRSFPDIVLVFENLVQKSPIPFLVLNRAYAVLFSFSYRFLVVAKRP